MIALPYKTHLGRSSFIPRGKDYIRAIEELTINTRTKPKMLWEVVLEKA